MNIALILIFIVVYFICMFNPSIIICKKKNGIDIRKLGNMDASISNTFKVLGKPLGVVIAIIEILKTVISYYIAILLAKYFEVDITSSIFKTTVILAVMIGHCFPIIYKFNGGKGILEFMTLMSIFNYKYLIISIVISLLVIAITKVLAKGVLIGCLVYLILALILGCSYIPALIISLCIILYKYKDNIHRIITKQERKI